MQKVYSNPDSFGRFIYVCSESKRFFKSTYPGAVFKNVLEDWDLQGKKDRSWPGGRQRPAGNGVKGGGWMAVQEETNASPAACPAVSRPSAPVVS